MYKPEEVPYAHYPEAVRTKIEAIINGHADDIVQDFYGSLTGNEKTAAFLSHEEIEARLKRSMVHWLKYTFDHETIQSDPEKFYNLQTNIGRVHSRASINLYLVNYAKVMLKRAVITALQAADAAHIELACYASEVLDYAVDRFNDSYLNELIETTRHQQALRIVSSGHQLALDLERSRNEVSIWGRDLIWRASHPSHRMAKSVAELNIYHWLKHRGSFTFVDEAICAQLLKYCTDLQSIEAGINKELEVPDSVGKRAAMNGLLEAAMRIADEIELGLAKAIDSIIAAEEQKDSLTKTLSRRYLAAIAQKEVLFSRSKQVPFSVMMIDADNFKAVNDRYGHRMGDQVLEQIAAILIERVRPGDYVFRYGGEEFLVIISEADQEVCRMVAEDIRVLIAALAIPVSDTDVLRVTVSIGVAEYDFHPDFLRTVTKADRRLYFAKEQGKNRVVVSD